MYRDPELPNGFQDADFEQRELEQLGKRYSELKKRGICTHGWRQCHTPTNDIPKGMAKCLECGKMASEETLNYEQRKALI